MCCPESFLAALAFALYKLRLKEGQVNLMVYAVYLLTCLCGGFLAGKRIQRRFFWGLLSGLLYFLSAFAVSWAMNMGSAIDMERSVTVMGICAGRNHRGDAQLIVQREYLIPVSWPWNPVILFSSIRCPLPGLIFSYFFFFFTPRLPGSPQPVPAQRQHFPKTRTYRPRLNPPS